MRRDPKAEASAINAILWRDWDPIGCGVPDDEYADYVWPVYKLLKAGAPRADVEARLRQIADEDLLCSVPEEKLRRVVDKLMALNLANTEG